MLPLSLLIGAGFLVLADTVARTVLSPAELPIGVVTALIGAPAFVWVLRGTRPVGTDVTSIAVADLTVTLDRAPVLRGVSCAAASGGWLALIGPNGAGKSTLIRAGPGFVA